MKILNLTNFKINFHIFLQSSSRSVGVEEAAPPNNDLKRLGLGGGGLMTLGSKSSHSISVRAPVPLAFVRRIFWISLGEHMNIP